MLHTENRIVINAPAELVFRVAADIADWPQILPHYRYVRVLNESKGRRVATMCASRSGIPVRWSSTQERRPEALEIAYHHTAGVTRGMDVIWRLHPGAAGVEVTIDHDLEPRRWWLRPRIARYIVGTLLVMHIADRTLQGVKRQAESLTREAA
jgi:ribosome-associated toxin RatA of RatAB toxin-antitoxin module